MKFTCERSILLKEIAIAQEIIASRNAISILSNIFLEAVDNTLYIKATDMKVNFETKLPVSVEEEGSTTIFGDKFLGILNSEPEGEIEFSLEDQKINIRHTSKKIRYKLNSIPSDQYPEFPVPSGGISFDIPIKDFKEMVEQTIFSVSDDQTRPNMCGICFEKENDKLIMVSTDGRRMAYVAKDLTGPEDFKELIVPPKILTVIMKRAGDEGLLSVTITDRIIFAKFGSYLLSSVLITGNFPNYRRVIPENQTYSLVINRNDLLDALKRVAVLVDKNSLRVYLGVAPEALRLSSEEDTLGAADDEISCRYEGEETTIAINYHFLEDPFKVMDTDEVEILFTNNGKAMTLKSVPEKDYFHVVMPMQN